MRNNGPQKIVLASSVNHGLSQGLGFEPQQAVYFLQIVSNEQFVPNERSHEYSCAVEHVKECCKNVAVQGEVMNMNKLVNRTC